MKAMYVVRSKTIGLGNKEPQGSTGILGDELAKVDFGFLLAWHGIPSSRCGDTVRWLLAQVRLVEMFLRETKILRLRARKPIKAMMKYSVQRHPRCFFIRVKPPIKDASRSLRTSRGQCYCFKGDD